MAQGFWQTLNTLQGAGTAITAASRTSMTVGSTQARFTLPANALKNLGDQLKLSATGILSCAATPGTARFDLAMATTAKLDTTAIPLNTTAQTNQLWTLEILSTLTTAGTAAVLTWTGFFTSPATVNVALPATGPGAGCQIIPYSGTATGASTAGASFDSTVSQLLDLYFTQTVATGSCQLLQMNISLLTATGF